MAQQKTTKKGWPKVGVLRRNESKDGGTYVDIKLEPGVEIYMNGEKLPMSDKRLIRLDDPRKKVEQLFEKGIITEADKDKRLETLSNNEWLRYEVIVPPPRT